MKSEIESRANALISRINGINNWIKSNPNITDPNMNEIMDCLFELGMVISLARKFYDEVGYPFDEEGNQYTHYSIVKFDENVAACNNAFNDMRTLRIKGMKDFFRTEGYLGAFNMMLEAIYRAQVGEFDTSLDEDTLAIKKEVFCKAVSILYYIWQRRRNEPTYQHDNINEINALIGMYQAYKDKVGIQVVTHYENGSCYKGPQFGEEIENLIECIKKNSVLAISDIKKPTTK